jgi:hypothetical protein
MVGAQYMPSLVRKQNKGNAPTREEPCTLRILRLLMRMAVMILPGCV